MSTHEPTLPWKGVVSIEETVSTVDGAGRDALAMALSNDLIAMAVCLEKEAAAAENNFAYSAHFWDRSHDLWKRHENALQSASKVLRDEAVVLRAHVELSRAVDVVAALAGGLTPQGVVLLIDRLRAAEHTIASLRVDLDEAKRKLNDGD